MPKENKTASALLRELHKLVEKIARKGLKDNTLDTVVQASISSIEPEQVKWSAQISSPAKGVQPITYSFNTEASLREALVESAKEIDKEKVEIAFHENMIISLKTRLKAHEEQIEAIKNGEVDKDEVEMEEV